MDYSKSSYISSLWSIQDALLQSYRSVFITIESIFIAVSITIQGFEVPDPIFLAPVLIIGLYVNKSWLEITSSRGLSVHFLQTLLRRHENPTKYPDPEMETAEPFERLRKFQDDADYKKAQMKAGDFIAGDFTRAALGSVIPIIFFAYWLFSSMYITINHAPITHEYVAVIQFYMWVAIVILAAYLFGNLAIKMIRKETNPEYKIQFFKYLLWLTVIFPGIVAHVHVVIPGYLPN